MIMIFEIYNVQTVYDGVIPRNALRMSGVKY